MMRFVFFGAVGFGIGGAITLLSLITDMMLGMAALPLVGILISGALGGASLAVYS